MVVFYLCNDLWDNGHWLKLIFQELQLSTIAFYYTLSCRNFLCRLQWVDFSLLLFIWTFSFVEILWSEVFLKQAEDKCSESKKDGESDDG